MSLPAILNVLIGLTTMYLILSMIASWINEWFAHTSQLRAKELEKAIEEFLENETMIKEFFANPLIRNLGEKAAKPQDDRKPSYIPPMTFAEAALEALLFGAIEQNKRVSIADIEEADHLKLIRDLGQAEDNTKSKVARIILAKARPWTLDSILKALATQFNDKMKRLFGTYQRKMSSYALVTGLVLAFFLNVDSLIVTQALYTNGPAIDITSEYVQALNPENFTLPDFDSTSDTPDEESPQEIDPARLLQLLDDLELPIGWGKHNPFAASKTASDRAEAAGESALLARLLFWTQKATGYFITALAVSRGAPFWYDLLSKLTSLRTSQKEETKIEEETPEKNSNGNEASETEETSNNSNGNDTNEPKAEENLANNGNVIEEGDDPPVTSGEIPI
jgi:hypothetical protein